MCDESQSRRRNFAMKSRSLVLVTLSAALALGWPAAATASCIRQTPQQQRNAAAVIFVGVALEGPTADGVQRFRVERYEKGSGADVRLVSTGVVAGGGGVRSTTSVSVEAAAGQRWRIYGTPGAGGALETNVCLGSTELAGAAPAADGTNPAPSANDRSAVQAASGDSADRRGLAVAALVLGLMLTAALFVARVRRRITRVGD
jgi:hypothetical protein